MQCSCCCSCCREGMEEESGQVEVGVREGKCLRVVVVREKEG
jgi:hypothetical protein